MQVLSNSHLLHVAGSVSPPPLTQWQIDVLQMYTNLEMSHPDGSFWASFWSGAWGGAYHMWTDN